jgi:hypothetical protein
VFYLFLFSIEQKSKHHHSRYEENFHVSLRSVRECSWLPPVERYEPLLPWMSERNNDACFGFGFGFCPIAW